MTPLTKEQLAEKQLLVARGKVTGSLNAICDSHEALRAKLEQAEAHVSRLTQQIQDTAWVRSDG